ncbi:MAG TPA: DinB family protein [Bryobacteraceae bacterium]|jgi:hypothetical protein
MTPDKKIEIVQMLETSREEVTIAVRAVPEAHATTKLDAGRWSVLECLEHIGAVEERLRGRLESSELLAAERAADLEKETKLAALVANRSVRAQAPGPVEPKGRFSSLAEALDHFHTQRMRTIQFVEERSGDLYRLTAEHLRFGALNGAEMVVIIAGHGRRHAEQIREITALLAGPLSK